MRFLGFDITKAAPNGTMPVPSGGRWWPLVREPFTGAWQQNEEIKLVDVLSNPYVMRCISLISGDIAKMRVRLVQLEASGIWTETTSPAFSPVLKKPNRAQNRIQFFRNWMESKLIHGNTYVLKERDNRGVVVRLYVLDPKLVTPLVAPDGSVYYDLKRDDLAGVQEKDGRLAVPARDIIHDRWNTFYHPLVGISPLYSASVAAIQGLRIQSYSTQFFANHAQPGGVLTAPGAIGDETAERLKTTWATNFSGANSGRVAVLGDGLKYEPMAFKAVDNQQIETYRASAETIATAFGVPPYKLAIGGAPTYNNVEALTQEYYAQALQEHIEHIELCLDEGLELPTPYGTEFDLDDLLRMDTSTLFKTLAEGVRGGFVAPNEARKRVGYKPLDGGDTVYLQDQDHSLEALAKRDARDDPFAKEKSQAEPAVAPQDAAASAEKAFFYEAAMTFQKELAA